jgi:hypothetical protein
MVLTRPPSGEQIPHGHIEGSADVKELAELGIAVSTLDALQRRPVKRDALNQLLLREIRIEASVLNVTT